MSAKKSDFGLIIKLLVALAIGAFLGRMANVEVMDAVASVKYALGQIIFYAVPLVIVGFITPAIARLGQNASKMLLTAVAIAYLSSVGAAAFSAASGYAIIPHLSVPTEVSGLVDLPKPSFVLDIPPLMSVMSALVTALLLGLAVSWTKAEIINKALAELEAIMTSVVTRVIIPILPFFVGATFCELSYEGRLTVQFPIFLKVIGIVIVGHFIWLAVLYSIGGILSGRPAKEVGAGLARVREAMTGLGYRHYNPIMSFCTLTLPASPALKLTDKGLIDVKACKIVPLKVEGQRTQP